MSLTERLRNKLNNRQREVFDRWVEEKPIWTISHGSVRSSKSYLHNIIWLIHVASFRDQGKSFIMTGNTLAALKRNVLDDLEETFGIDTSLDKFNTFNLFGNKIRCFGTDKADSFKAIKGFTAYGAYHNEIQLSHVTAIEECKKRCSGEGAIHIGDCNPDNPNHWVYTDIIQNDGQRLSSGRLLYMANLFLIDHNSKKNGGVLDEDYIETLKTSLSGTAYDRDILGLWVAREGIVYDCFIETQMTCTNPPITNSFAGVDWGFEHFGVIVYFTEYREKIIIYDIIKERHKGIDWWVEQKQDNCKEYYCDSARPEYVKAFNGIEANKAVIEGIDKVYSMFYNGTLLVAERCKKLFMEEVYKYRWKPTAPKEQPIKENDDIMDAIRYALFTKYGTQQEENLYKKLYGRKKKNNVSKNN